MKAGGINRHKCETAKMKKNKQTIMHTMVVHTSHYTNHSNHNEVL